MSRTRGAVLRAFGAGPVRAFATGPIGWRVASRFVAGTSLEDAFAAASSLRGEGIATILDHLGENATSPAQEEDAASAYVAALRRIRDEGLRDVSISVKLTQLGLDTSVQRCLERMSRVVEAAGADGPVVMIDMEASRYVDATLEVHAALRAGGARVGVCLQTYLHRTPADLAALPPSSTVRLVKGAYLEPADVAIQDRAGVAAAFAALGATALARGHVLHVASHDPDLVAGAERHVEERGIPWDRIEFQMLHGVRRDLQIALARRDRPVRIYVPYGTEWYPYFTRRLAERPANMVFFLSNLWRGARAPAIDGGR